MSSHHIVRENQEPALLIKDVHSIDGELLGQLLEWSPTVVTNQSSYEILHAQGFKVDVVFASNIDFIPQEHLELIMIGDLDFISQGISLLLSKNHTAINIIADEVNVNELRDFTDNMTIVWLHQNLRSIYVHSGFEKWKPKGEYLFLEEEITELATHGLLKKDQNKYQTESDGFYKINFSNIKPVLLTELI